MKILLVHNSYQQPGGEDVVFNQERELLESAGHQVLTYCRSNHEIGNYTGLKRLPLAVHMVWARDTRREIASFLHRQKPDLVHIHNTFLMASPSIYSACKEAHTPVVQTLHNYRLFCPAANFFRSGQVCEECVERNLWRSVHHACYRESRAQTASVAFMLEVHRLLRTGSTLVDAFVPLTEFARRKFIACGMPAEKTITKPNFVHPDPGPRQSADDYALFIGRLSEEKGPETLLRAWSRLSVRPPLRIIGDGPLRSRLEAGTNGRARDICFEGQLGRPQVLAALKSGRFLVFPSWLYESFPMVIVEAFACGIPVIASRLGAAQEIVEDGRTGLHFTPGDPDDLAAKVAWAWTHPEETAAMGRAARAEYEAKYTSGRNYQMLMEIYEHVLGERR
jgi:glycosyltransferase involved in cell wall biosynthesis